MSGGSESGKFGQTYVETTAARFWEKVDRGADSECWLWQGTKTKPSHCGLQYGLFGVRDKGRSFNYRAHRLAYMLTKGRVDDGLQVCHKCDNTLCVNPAHLWAGTNQENVADRDRKGRVQRGERHYKAILTKRQVRHILESDDPPSVISERLGVSTHAIHKVRSGDNWKHVRTE